MEETIGRLLKQQQDFLVDVLSTNRAWMIAQLEEQKTNLAKMQENPREPTITSTNISVPAFPPYVHTKQSFDSYIAQLTQHFEAYSVTKQEQKRAFLLSWVGADCFELLSKLFGTEDIQTQTYESIKEKLSTHYKENVHILASRYEFLSSKMKPEQKYSEWVAELRGIARNCRFVCSNNTCKTSFIDDLLRDILVLNSPHEPVRTAALQKPNPALADVMALAESYETTQAMKKRMSSSTAERSEVFQLKQHQAEKKLKPSASKSNCFQSCSGCGKHHSRSQCKFRNAQCRKCNRFGHIAPVCKAQSAITDNKNNKKEKQPQTNNNNAQRSVSTINFVASITSTVPNKVGNKYLIEIGVNEVPVKFQMDTGATCSVIGLDVYNEIGKPSLTPYPTGKLIAYGGSAVSILGTIDVTIHHGQIKRLVKLVVANVQQNSEILGTDLLEELGLCACQAHHVNAVTTDPNENIEGLLKKFADVFEGTLGYCTISKAELRLKHDATPKYFKSRPIPFAQLKDFKLEAQRLTDCGIWKPITFSKWAAPIVVVQKKDGLLRICGDFKAVNAQLEVDHYPIPRIEELCRKLRGGTIFAKIDLSDAYLQVGLTEEAKQLMVVNTPLGLFQYQRLPMGVASAPALFQKLLEQVIEGIPMCINYLDDILVAGKSIQELLENLQSVFERLQASRLKCRKSKCTFMQRRVEYVGFVLDAAGCTPSPAKVSAISEMPRPKNFKELQAFLGKINYYNKFISNFADKAAPLNQLRRQGEKFRWGEKQEKAFLALKHQLSRAPLLIHFDDQLPLILATDASSHGIGAFISHRMPDGSEKPIAFASKTLDHHQIRYSQIEKEALSIVFGVKKFHQFLFGRQFTLLTDHKPLVSIFTPDKQLPSVMIQRLQRWALLLMSYRYTIRYRPTDKHCNADALSRLPVGPDAEFDQSEACMQVESDLTASPLNVQHLANLTAKDRTLKQVWRFIEKGWPEKLPSQHRELQPYFVHRHALSLEMGVIILRTEYTRVVLPLTAQATVLELLHEGHWGMTRMKQMARQHCWWPSMDTHIEKKVSQCEICQQQSTSSPARAYTNWPVAERPWQRLHLDFAGPFHNATWLICIDAFSKYPFVTKMASITAKATIDALKVIFSVEGLPDTIVTDNGRQFSAAEFQVFCNSNGITHLTTAPFHPASNGEAERFVRTFKQAFKKAVADGKNHLDSLLTILST
ncbi:uncharacterized protein K02A2.6-like [Rhagoletis pomonella]|uniref:uncharacterized protein K02A2.6-like n=1 Tax=Rhagoletis pomonella TaxID=28610 RepID=UPI0017815F58|nr:uncharacterized protein K02A2.6-like [Rhagoletis pomonella]